MHVNICFADIDKSDISRCKDHNHFNTDNEGNINNYLHKAISPISSLQDKDSEFIDSNIQHNYISIYLSNFTAMPHIASFSTGSSQ